MVKVAVEEFTAAVSALVELRSSAEYPIFWETLAAQYKSTSNAWQKSALFCYSHDDRRDCTEKPAFQDSLTSLVG
jgi:hypothetical protein